MVAWPATVPLTAARESYREEPERHVRTYDPPVGASAERQQTRLDTMLVSFDIEMTFTQWDALAAFYRNTIADGILPFTRPSPRNPTGPSSTFKFIGEPVARDIEGATTDGSERCRVSIALRQIPG